MVGATSGPRRPARSACIALGLTASRFTVVDGVLEAHGPGIAALFDLIAPRRGIAAMTLGHVVLGRSAAALAETRAHERVHVTQCERWGPFFLPAYAAASVSAWRVAATPTGTTPLSGRVDRGAASRGR